MMDNFGLFFCSEEIAGEIRRAIDDVCSIDINLRRSVVRHREIEKYAQIAILHVSVAKMIIRHHADGKFIMSRERFTGVGERVTRDFVDTVINETRLGLQLRDRLSNVGLFEFMQRPSSDENFKTSIRIMELLFASLILSTRYCSDISELNPKDVKDWIRFYRDPFHARWRAELWPSSRDFAFQCLREITRAFARYFDDKSFYGLSHQVRSDSLSQKSMRFIRLDPPEHVVKWLGLYDEWLLDVDRPSKGHDQTFKYIVRWLESIGDASQISDPELFLAQSDRAVSFSAFLKSLAPPNRKKGKERPRDIIPHLSVARRLSSFLVQRLTSTTPLYPLVSEREWQAAKKKEGRVSQDAVVKARPLPQKLKHLARSILEEGEKGWPGSISLCNPRATGRDGRPYTLYCPVLPILYLTAFHLPLRIGQAARLDSGEGDLERFNGATLTWESNTGPLRGYWASCDLADGGYARIVSIDPLLTGFWINTNKTGSPYPLPWQHEQIHGLLYWLRLWQEQYNPIGEPTEPTDYVQNLAERGGEDEDEITALRAQGLAHLPAIFPLFRLPSRDGVRGEIPDGRRTNEFWQWLMAEVERRYNNIYPDDQIKIVEFNEVTGQPQGSIYNPHGLRSSGITEMIDNGVPIEVVAFHVVGHATIGMTARYTKTTPAKLHAMLSEASETARAEAIRQEMTSLRSLDLAALQARTAAINPAAISGAASMGETERLLWSNVGIGICPWDGARCEDGGPLIRKNTKKGQDISKYGPVPGGARNCLLCRHFITGPAWRDHLEMHGTLLMRRYRKKNQESEAIDLALEELQVCFNLAITSERPSIDQKISMHSHHKAKIDADRTLIMTATTAANTLIHACDRITGDGSDLSSSDALIIRDAASAEEFVRVSTFEEAAFLRQAAVIRVLPVDDEIEGAMKDQVDQIIFDAGYQPVCFSSHDESTKEKLYDAFKWLILDRTTRAEHLAFEDKKLRLSDVMSNDDVQAYIDSRMTTHVPLSRHSTLQIGPPGAEAAR